MDDDLIVHRPIFGDVFGDRGDYTKGAFYASRRTFLVSDDEPGKKSKDPSDWDANKLKPPAMFQTRAQSRRYNKESKPATGKTADFKAMFGGMSIDAAEKSKKAKSDENRRKRKPKKVIIQKYSTTDPEAWVEEFQCGVRLWVNKGTGEVSDECPWIECSPACPPTCGCYGKWDENGSYIGTMCSTYYQMDMDDRSLDDRSVSTLGDENTSYVSSQSFSPMPGESMRSRNSNGNASVHDGEEDDNESYATGSLVYDSRELNELFEQLDKESASNSNSNSNHRK